MIPSQTKERKLRLLLLLLMVGGIVLMLWGAGTIAAAPASRGSKQDSQRPGSSPQAAPSFGVFLPATSRPVRTPTSFPIYVSSRLPTEDEYRVYQVVRRYRDILVSGRWSDLLQLVSRQYYETNGTPDKSDDCDYETLKKYLLSLQTGKVTVVRLSIELQEIYFHGGARGTVSLKTEVLYRFPLEGKTVMFRRQIQQQRLKLLLEKGQWLIHRGL